MKKGSETTPLTLLASIPSSMTEGADKSARFFLRWVHPSTEGVLNAVGRGILKKYPDGGDVDTLYVDSSALNADCGRDHLSYPT